MCTNSYKVIMMLLTTFKIDPYPCGDSKCQLLFHKGVRLAQIQVYPELVLSPCGTRLLGSDYFETSQHSRNFPPLVGQQSPRRPEHCVWLSQDALSLLKESPLRGRTF
jgi:hypothetical protein